MSGALIQLVSKGVQDVYLMSDEGHSFFRTKFARHTNFSQAPKYIKTISDKDTSIIIPVLGDVINGLWFEADSNSVHNIASNLFYNSTIDLFIGGQKLIPNISIITVKYGRITWRIRTISHKNSITRLHFPINSSSPFTFSSVITKPSYL